MTLTWSLVIATYNRARSLRRCLELAVTQTRPPREIIVVDGSDDWQATKAGIERDVLPITPGISMTYVPARVRSLPAQRNQGLALATSDVLFLIDDDSFMYRDCAEKVMRVYEADVECRVAGVSPALAGAAPPDPLPAPADAATGHQTTAAGPGDARPVAPRVSLKQRLVGWARNRATRLLDAEHLLLPYDADYPQHSVSLDMKALNVQPVRYLHGMRMTYRREPIQKEGFDEMLQRFAAAEDLDASYRVSRYGMLLACFDAHLYHAQDSSGRLSRFTRAAMGLINLAALYRLKCHDPVRALRTFRYRVWKRAGIEMMLDLVRGRFSVASARGGLFALRTIRKLGAMQEPELRQWLPSFQNALVERNPS